MRKSFALLAIALAAFLIGSAPAGADPGDPPESLRLGVVSFDGKKKLKVGKKVRIVTSCSKDCDARIRVRLITPVTTYKYNSSTAIPATGTWTLNLLLSRFARSYLKKNIRRSRMEVTLIATDFETATTSTRIRNFRFRK